MLRHSLSLTIGAFLVAGLARLEVQQTAPARTATSGFFTTSDGMRLHWV
jgi:hypothetical protein